MSLLIFNRFYPICRLNVRLTSWIFSLPSVNGDLRWPFFAVTLFSVLASFQIGFDFDASPAQDLNSLPTEEFPFLVYIVVDKLLLSGLRFFPSNKINP